MTVEVLDAAMNQTDYRLAEEMNLQSDAVIINQCQRTEEETTMHSGHTIRMVSMEERGVGRSRNNALLRATGDLLLFSDEDITYRDGYAQFVERAFVQHPEADVILFNIQSANPKRPLLFIDKWKRVSRRTALKYGCARIAVRRQRLLQANVWFSLLFGGGAPYGSGEDTLFLQDCIKKGLRVYQCPVVIGTAAQQTSTWFNGFDHKYYFDKGVLMGAIFRTLCWPYGAVTAAKAALSGGDNSFFQMLQWLFDGIRHWKNCYKNNKEEGHD